jgi:hypothetical protein
VAISSWSDVTAAIEGPRIRCRCWEQEVAAVPLDRGIHTWPPPWSEEGTDLATVSRRAISFAELVSFHEDMARQVEGAR